MAAATFRHTTFDPARIMDRLRVRRLAADSRKVRPGDTFVAYPGETRDGRDHIDEAVARGATSVLWESEGSRRRAAITVPNIGVRNLRRQVGVIAAELQGHPSATLWTVGVTGTNGKTTCSQWIAQGFSRQGRPCAVVGTLGSGFAPHLAPTPNTTPDAIWLHRRLRAMARQGARAVCMEVSSHALAQDRVSGMAFDVALFTNLTRDHLDYHGTLARYRAAKARLFRWPGLACAVLNLDDPFGADLADRASTRGTRVVGYGFGPASTTRRSARIARVQGRNLRAGTDGVSFDVSSPWGAARVRSRVIGRFNAANLLGTLSVLLASDMPLDASVAALQRMPPVPGRTERYGGARRPLVVVDYAHTPDALEKVLAALRETLPRNARLHCVFGCGGERDRGKRPLMGRIAARISDRVYVTSDNPRGEDPRRIIADIVAGAGVCEAIEDRGAAIRSAIRGARAGDIVLVAGKGHESYQEIGSVRRRFSDAGVVRAALGSSR